MAVGNCGVGRRLNAALCALLRGAEACQRSAPGSSAAAPLVWVPSRAGKTIANPSEFNRSARPSLGYPGSA